MTEHTLVDLADAADSVGTIRQTRQQQALRAELHQLYGSRPDFDQWFDALTTRVVREMALRSPELQALDRLRLNQTDWFTSHQTLGYTAYVDRFAGTLAQLPAKIPYLQELRVTLLHLLPFLRARAGNSDGGFAVASFDEVEPSLGSMDDLRALTAALRGAGISLCADFVLNHVSDDHAWAQAARGGDAQRRAYFHVVEDQATVQRWEASLGQVFPETAPGNFTFVAALDAWVWTTFYPFQWDLNYANPEVFAEMALAMLRLANAGVEVFRLDSTAYLWKAQGTRCMNLPEVHMILQAFRALIEWAAPGVLLLAEAVVPTQDIPPYFGQGERWGRECHMAYHSSLMAGLWASLAEENAQLVTEVIRHTPALPPRSAWLTYVRCHDDIGWNVLRPECALLGDASANRLRYVADFFAGAIPDSYARGLAFQAGDGNAVHGTNGMAASLVGLEQAGDEGEVDAALRRLRLLFGVSLSFGGIPLVYMGDELAMTNASWSGEAHDCTDSRQVHRPTLNPVQFAQRLAPDTLAGKAFAQLRQLSAARMRIPQLASSFALNLVAQDNPAMLIYRRGTDFVFVGNFSAETQALDLSELRQSLAGLRWYDWLAERYVDDAVELQPWSMHWLGLMR